MSLERNSLIDLARDIAQYPQMFASTPEEAHGMVLVIATLLIHDSSRQTMGKCMRDAMSLVALSMSGIYDSDAIVPCLADEAYPDRNASFDCFRTNCRVFLKNLLEVVKEND